MTASTVGAAGAPHRLPSLRVQPAKVCEGVAEGCAQPLAQHFCNGTPDIEHFQRISALLGCTQEGMRAGKGVRCKRCEEVGCERQTGAAVGVGPDPPLAVTSLLLFLLLLLLHGAAALLLVESRRPVAKAVELPGRSCMAAVDIAIVNVALNGCRRLSLFRRYIAVSRVVAR